MTKSELHKHFTHVVKMADAAGRAAVENARVTPMVVGTPKNLMGSLLGGDDGGFDPNEPTYYVPDGVCGFAWVNVRAEKGPKGQVARKFQNWLKGTVKSRYNVARAFGLPAALADATEQNEYGWHNRAYGLVVGKPRHSKYHRAVQVWVSGYRQSLQKKEAYAHAFAAVVSEHVEGVLCYSGSRMD